MSKYELTMGKELDLKAEQAKSLASPLLPANFILRMMVLAMDVIYGKGRTLPKFLVIEILARYPYWAWENRAYIWFTKLYTRAGWVKKPDSDRLVRLIELGRKSQDNEQHHMLMIEDIMRQKDIRLSFWKRRLIPKLLTYGYFFLTRAMFFIRPAWSFGMNARFESHAEHEYMKMVAEHPEWDAEPVDTAYFEYYPRQKTMADLFRRIGLDERDHMHESMEYWEHLNGREFR